ncbi:DMT family transporter [Cognatiyoonia sp.]|uniref:DMT family transporter n=1 Tax=Cognatiyoonia sp. TaxID=2211652 RepID=UPI003F69F2AB
MTENLRGALLMTVSMSAFAVEDAFIKMISATLPTGQIIMVIGAGGTLILLLWQLLRGQKLWTRAYLDPLVLLRSSFEVLGTLFFVNALATIPLTTASAVIQATPLVVAMGAAMFLGQNVGWRRWLAIGIGFIGVLIVLRPGTDSFTPLTLLAVGGMLGLAARDITTRAVTVDITGVQLSIHALICLIFAGWALMPLQGGAFVIPNLTVALLLIGCVAIGLIAYLLIIAATRIGNAAVISSFRYARMPFAILVAGITFAEVPDLPTIIGVTIIISAGIFTLWRESRGLQPSPAEEAKV